MLAWNDQGTRRYHIEMRLPFSLNEEQKENIQQTEHKQLFHVSVNYTSNFFHDIFGEIHCALPTSALTIIRASLALIGICVCSFEEWIPKVMKKQKGIFRRWIFHDVFAFPSTNFVSKWISELAINFCRHRINPIYSLDVSSNRVQTLLINSSLQNKLFDFHKCFFMLLFCHVCFSSSYFFALLCCNSVMIVVFCFQRHSILLWKQSAWHIHFYKMK